MSVFCNVVPDTTSYFVTTAVASTVAVVKRRWLLDHAIVLKFLHLCTDTAIVMSGEWIDADNASAIMKSMLNIFGTALSTSLTTIARIEGVSYQAQLTRNTEGLKTLLTIYFSAERTEQTRYSLHCAKVIVGNSRSNVIKIDIWRNGAHRSTL